MNNKRTISGLLFDIINIIFLIGLMIASLYPFLNILFASVSEPDQLRAFDGVLLHPIGLQWDAYKAVLQNVMILTGYRNTLFYVLVGTSLNVFLTLLLGYALSRRGPLLVNGMMVFIVITMFFNGGMIPTYLMVKQLGLLNTWFSVIFPGLISTFNLIIMRTHFYSIPAEIEESAKIDGANDLTVLFRIMLPLSMPILSVMILYYGVAHWNAWFNASIYLTKTDLYPLQLVLRNILVSNATDDTLVSLGARKGQDMNEIVKYSTIVVSTVPILFIYPFLQKYFVKGALIGAIKG